MSSNSQISTTPVKDWEKEVLDPKKTSLEDQPTVPGQPGAPVANTQKSCAAPMVIEETSMEMEEQLKMDNMPRQVEGTNLELYETRENAMTRE